MLIFTGGQRREIIENLYPPLDAAASPGSGEMPQSPCLQTLLHHGHPRIVHAVDIPALIEIASRSAYTIDLVASVGDAALDSTPIVRVFGAGAPLPEESLRPALELGGERTFEQDPKYGIRLLVDIATKALSPAINDPTSAVQGLDQIEDLLVRLGRRRLEIGAFCDAQGELRVLVAFPHGRTFFASLLTKFASMAPPAFKLFGV
jgi:uncharacterized membrane protein